MSVVMAVEVLSHHTFLKQVIFFISKRHARASLFKDSAYVSPPLVCLSLLSDSALLLVAAFPSLSLLEVSPFLSLQFLHHHHHILLVPFLFPTFLPPSPPPPPAKKKNSPNLWTKLFICLKSRNVLQPWPAKSYTWQQGILHTHKKRFETPESHAKGISSCGHC